MADLNQVFIIGRLTADPELRHTPSGAAVADLRIATSRTWKDKNGEKKEESLFIDVTVWQNQAETCCQYLKKGSQVHVDGFLKSESWEDKTTGEKRSKIKVEADRVQFLDRRQDGGGDDAPAPQKPAQGRGPAPGNRPQGNGGGYGGAPSRTPQRPTTPPQGGKGGEDDIPF